MATMNTWCPNTIAHHIKEIMVNLESKLRMSWHRCLPEIARLENWMLLKVPVGRVERQAMACSLYSGSLLNTLLNVRWK
jgi:hypothetical protein